MMINNSAVLPTKLKRSITANLLINQLPDLITGGRGEGERHRGKVEKREKGKDRKRKKEKICKGKEREKV